MLLSLLSFVFVLALIYQLCAALHRGFGKFAKASLSCASGSSGRWLFGLVLICLVLSYERIVEALPKRFILDFDLWLEHIV